MKDYILLITMHADPAMPPGYDEWGGTHTYMRELLDIFGTRNIPCLLVTRKSMRFLPVHEQFNHCCKIVRLINGNDGPMSKLELCHYHFKNLECIEEVVQKQDGPPRIIHSVYWNSGRLAMELSKKWNIPYVHSIISNSRGRVMRGAKESIPERAEYEQKIYEHATKLLCVSEDERDDLEKLYHISPEKMIVCGQLIAYSFSHPAHDINGFPRMISNITEKEQSQIAEIYNKAIFYNNSTDHFWIYKAFTYFGRMDKNKGILSILNAWYILYMRHEELCPPLWMAGGSIPEIDVLRQEAKGVIPDLDKLEQSHRIVWWGYLNSEGLSTILMKTQVLIMQSLYEPGGRVAVEAMMEKVPVIATPNGFAKDIIIDWRNGFLVKHGDVQKLAARMEHFIRQPLLGNSLGSNANESAKEIERNWSFAQNHIFAYGLDVEPIIAAKAVKHSSYARRKIDLFPYCEHRLSNEYFCQVFYNNTGVKEAEIANLDPGICTSDMKSLTAIGKEYIVKHVVTRLATSPLFNPFLKDQLVRDVQEHFEIEVNIYQRLHSDVLVCVDPFHHLLYLRKLREPKMKKGNYLKNCIHYLSQRPNIVTEEEKKKFLDIMVISDESYDGIENTLRNLKKQLPAFYFECSGMFSNQLSWTIAPYVLEYNRNVFTQTDYLYLKELCHYFHSRPYQMSANLLRDINLDIEQRHLMLHGDELQLIDHEKTAIGIVEMDIASFLYDNYRNTEGIVPDEFWEYATPYLDEERLDKKEVLSAIAYRTFYDIIVNSVLFHGQQDREIKLLKVLKEIIEKELK